MKVFRALILIFLSTSSFAGSNIRLTHCDEPARGKRASCEDEGFLASITDMKDGRLRFLTQSGREEFLNVAEVTNNWIDNEEQNDESAKSGVKSIQDALDSTSAHFQIVAHAQSKNWSVNYLDGNDHFKKSLSISRFIYWVEFDNQPSTPTSPNYNDQTLQNTVLYK